MSNKISESESESALVDKVNNVVNDLVLLIFTHQSCVQLDKVFAASCSLSCAVVACCFVHHITRSSAYIAHLTASGNCLIRSLMKIRKRVGDRTPPCGTPCLRRFFLLLALSMITLALRLCRYDFIHLYIVVSLAEIITNVDEFDLIMFKSISNPIQKKTIKIILMLFS